MKKTIRLTESDLKHIIRKSVNKLLKEGTTSTVAMEKWDELKEQVGCEQMVNDIFNYLNCDQIDQLIEWFNQDYELWDDKPEEIEDDEEEDEKGFDSPYTQQELELMGQWPY